MELLYRLQGAGCNVRLHSCEYFIRQRGFVALLVLYPTEGVARLRGIPWNHELSERVIPKVLQILREMDPGLRVQVC